MRSVVPGGAISPSVTDNPSESGHNDEHRTVTDRRRTGVVAASPGWAPNVPRQQRFRRVFPSRPPRPGLATSSFRLDPQWIRSYLDLGPFPLWPQHARIHRRSPALPIPPCETRCRLLVMQPAFPVSPTTSAPPRLGTLSRRRTTPAADLDGRPRDQPGTLPTFTARRSTGRCPTLPLRSSQRVRRSPSSWHSAASEWRRPTPVRSAGPFNGGLMNCTSMPIKLVRVGKSSRSRSKDEDTGSSVRSVRRSLCAQSPPVPWGIIAYEKARTRSPFQGERLLWARSPAGVRVDPRSRLLKWVDQTIPNWRSPYPQMAGQWMPGPFPQEEQ